MHSVPSLFRTLLHESLDEEHFAALRHVLLAGEPLQPAFDVLGELALARPEAWPGVYSEPISLTPNITTAISISELLVRSRIWETGTPQLERRNDCSSILPPWN